MRFALHHNTRKYLWRTVLVFISGYILMAIFSITASPFLVWNMTPSVPIGWYLKTQDPGSPFAAICLVGDQLAEAIRLGLPRGACQSGYAPILKPIYAQRVVVLTPSGFIAQGQLLQNTAPRAISSKGKPLTHYPYGTYGQWPGYLWLVSTYNRSSYDSRYFGPVRKDQVFSYLRPVLVAPRGTFGTE